VVPAIILAQHAGPMTLDGTNSYPIRTADAGSTVVVDPGPNAGRVQSRPCRSRPSGVGVRGTRFDIVLAPQAEN
jgi:hypothetical protein